MPRSSIVIAFLLAGCASSPAYREPSVPLPATFREAESPGSVGTPVLPSAPARSGARARQAEPAESVVAIAHFWQGLGDTTLSRLVGDVLRANLDLSAAAARMRGARSARTESALDLGPTVTFGAGYTRQRLASAAFPVNGGFGRFPDQDVWDGGFDAGWELDLFGRLRRTLQAQGAFVAMADENLRDLQVTLTAELARAYFELRGAQEQLAVAEQNAENQRRTLKVTEQRLDAGRGTAFDTERAQAQLSTTLASIPLLEARVAAAQYRIGVLVGRAPAALARELAAPSPLPAPPAVIELDRPADLIARRPDVAAAERRVAAEGAMVGAAKAELLPRITLGGSAGYAAGEFSALGDRGTFRYAVGPVISWPALNLGRVKARIDQTQAREAEAEAQYNQTVLLALEEVETAFIRYRSALSRVERIQDAAAASERAAGLARLRFSEGVADFLQVLDAERTQLEAQNQLTQSRTEAATAYAALYKALGGSLPAAPEGPGGEQE